MKNLEKKSLKQKKNAQYTYLWCEILELTIDEEQQATKRMAKLCPFYNKSIEIILSFYKNNKKKFAWIIKKLLL